MSYAIRPLVHPSNGQILNYCVGFVNSEGEPVPDMGLFTGTQEQCIDFLHYINGGHVDDDHPLDVIRSELRSINIVLGDLVENLSRESLPMIEGLEELLSLDAGIDLERQMRQIGIERASRNAGDEWFMEAMHVVQDYLTKHVVLLADDLWDEGLLVEPCNTRRCAWRCGA